MRKSLLLVRVLLSIGTALGTLALFFVPPHVLMAWMLPLLKRAVFVCGPPLVWKFYTMVVPGVIPPNYSARRALYREFLMCAAYRDHYVAPSMRMHFDPRCDPRASLRCFGHAYEPRGHICPECAAKIGGEP